MRLCNGLAGVAFGLGTALASSGASALLITPFTDRTAWEAASGFAIAPSFVEDFSGFSADLSFNNTPVSLTNFTLTGLDIGSVVSQNAFNKIDVAPFTIGSVNGTTDVILGTDFGDGDSVEIAFNGSLSAFGADFLGFGDFEGSLIDLFSANVLVGSVDRIAQTNAPTGFFGLVVDESFDRLVLRSTFNRPGGGEIGFADNFSGVTAVPEPATLAMFGIGLAGLGLLGWCTRRRESIQPMLV